VEAQGGDPQALEREDGLSRAPVVLDAPAPRAGKIAAIDVREIGYAVNALGAGRRKMGDSIDPAVGILMQRRLGDGIRAGDSLAEIHARTEDDAEGAARRIARAVRIEEEAPPPPPLILEFLET
jgi:thymidine phosphorylase